MTATERKLLREAARVQPPFKGVGARGPWLPVARALASRGLLSFVARGRDDRGYRVHGYAITFEGRRALTPPRRMGPIVLWRNFAEDEARYRAARERRFRKLTRELAERCRRNGRAFIPEYVNGEVRWVPNPKARVASA